MSSLINWRYCCKYHPTNHGFYSWNGSLISFVVRFSHQGFRLLCLRGGGSSVVSESLSEESKVKFGSCLAVEVTMSWEKLRCVKVFGVTIRLDGLLLGLMSRDILLLGSYAGDAIVEDLKNPVESELLYSWVGCRWNPNTGILWSCRWCWSHVLEIRSVRLAALYYMVADNWTVSDIKMGKSNVFVTLCLFVWVAHGLITSWSTCFSCL